MEERSGAGPSLRLLRGRGRATHNGRRPERMPAQTTEGCR